MQVDDQCLERVDASQKTSTPSNARRVNCVLWVARKLIWNQFLKHTRKKKEMPQQMAYLISWDTSSKSSNTYKQMEMITGLKT